MSVSHVSDGAQSHPGTPGPLQHSTSFGHPLTRTVAIIKNHALNYRFDIEPRILEASFEIVKERQMEFDTETDPEALYELFGDDADSLAEGPVWVYVLERRRAVEVWTTLMGDRDPEVARQQAPTSLHALYGLSLQQNGLMGSPDNETAEIQIASLFASSPPFPTTELPDERYSSTRTARSGQEKTASDEGYAHSNPSIANGGRTSAPFRARPIPISTLKPDIVPRMTRAASLRTGLAVNKSASGPRAPPTKERLAQTFHNIPGHKRSETIAVASTAAPTIAPRMTKAASLRIGKQPAAPPIRRRALTTEEKKMEEGTKKNTFEGVPGHKRRESIAVMSVKAPVVAPRLNKSAALRAQKEHAPPSSFMFRGSSAPKVPGLSRTTSNESLSPPRIRPASQASLQPPRQSIAPRSPSAAAIRPLNTNASESSSAPTPAPPSKPKPRPSSIAAPSIAPRTNRSAALRAAKLEAEAAAAAKKNKRLSIRPATGIKLT